MSSSLEYLPLFIFVLTLTYKKKKNRKAIKKKQHPTTKRMFRCWRRNGPSAPLSHNVWGLGPGVAVAHRSSSWGAQGNVSRFPSYIWTQHARIMSSGTDSVLCGHVPSSHWPLSNTTLLWYQMQALWPRRTHGEASLFYVIYTMT